MAIGYSVPVDPRVVGAAAIRSGERWIWAIVLGVFAFVVLDMIADGRAGDVAAYVGSKVLLLPFVAIGVFYRTVRRDEPIASTALCLVALAAFTHVAATSNHAFLPLSRPTIDGTLAAIDAAFGVHWPSVMAFAAGYETLAAAGKLVYASSLPQMVIVLFVLGLSGRIARLQRFVLSTMLGALCAIAFWIVWPSFGPSTLYELTPEIVAAVRPTVGPDYGAELLALAEHGHFAGIEAKGLIAFPSFHTVMALLVPLALWPMRWVRWPAVTLNAAMIPAIIVHGGHFAIDLVGGAVLAVAVWSFVRWLVPEKRWV